MVYNYCYGLVITTLDFQVCLVQRVQLSARRPRRRDECFRPVDCGIPLSCQPGWSDSGGKHVTDPHQKISKPELKTLHSFKGLGNMGNKRGPL